jgi:uncharacterized membrane protein YgcG
MKLKCKRCGHTLFRGERHRCAEDQPEVIASEDDGLFTAIAVAAVISSDFSPSVSNDSFSAGGGDFGGGGASGGFDGGGAV